MTQARARTASQRLGLPPPAEAARILALLAQPPEAAARLLLGMVLVRQLGRRRVAARIVETEAYLGQDDPAAHAYRGRTPRTAPLWGLPGTVYVYFIYGMHHCLNLSVEQEGVPGCVLIRAAEPLGELPPGSCRGPGRLCRALEIDVSLSGRHVFEPRSRLWLREGAPPARVAVTGRVGIRHAAEEPRRFYDEESRAVSAGRAFTRAVRSQGA
jgi:DNA-3-methyladenine glycosylase